MPRWALLGLLLLLVMGDVAGCQTGRTRLTSRSRYHLRWGPLLRSLPPQMVPFYALFEPASS
jgi:hypothetical protein